MERAPAEAVLLTQPLRKEVGARQAVGGSEEAKRRRQGGGEDDGRDRARGRRRGDGVGSELRVEVGAEVAVVAGQYVCRGAEEACHEVHLMQVPLSLVVLQRPDESLEGAERALYERRVYPEHQLRVRSRVACASRE